MTDRVKNGRHKISWLLLSIVISVSNVGLAHAGGVVGKIENLTGEVSIVRDGKTMPAQHHGDINNGDTFVLQKKSLAVILFAQDGKLLKIPLRGPAKRKISGQEDSELLAVAWKPYQASAKRNTDADAEIDMHPAYTAFHKYPFALDWSSSQLGQLVDFRLEGKNLSQLQWNRSETAVEFLPSSTATGRFDWTANFADGSNQVGRFVVLTPDQASDCKKRFVEQLEEPITYDRAQKQIEVLASCDLNVDALRLVSTVLDKHFPDDEILAMIEAGLIYEMSPEN